MGKGLAKQIDKYIFIVTFVFVLPIFYFRGHGYRKMLWGDDAELVYHQLNNFPEFKFLSTWDLRGFFDPFHGYTALYSRFMTKTALIAGVDNFTVIVFFFDDPILVRNCWLNFVHD